MDNLEELNKDPIFREYMTVEEDRRKCHNSDLRIAREEGIKEANIETAKKLLSKGFPIDDILECVKISKEELEKLKNC